MNNRDSLAAPPPSYGYGLLVEECARRGIGRSKAYQLAREGFLETFNIGTRRMVYIASLEELPKRLLSTWVAANDDAPGAR